MSASVAKSYFDSEILTLILLEYLPHMALTRSIVGDTEFPMGIELLADTFNSQAQPLFVHVIDRHYNGNQRLVRQPKNARTNIPAVGFAQGVVHNHPFAIRFCLLSEDSPQNAAFRLASSDFFLNPSKTGLTPDLKASPGKALDSSHQTKPNRHLSPAARSHR